MQVINIHKRKLKQSKELVVQLFKTLATKEDKIWPFENWPALRFKNGLYIGSKGGHGRIRYTIIDFKEDQHIKFQFTKPDGFIGTHELCIQEVSNTQTEISHEINMNTTSIMATILWWTTIRWLHDALIVDAFDKAESYFLEEKKVTKYTLWVKVLRAIYKRNSFKQKQLN